MGNSKYECGSNWGREAWIVGACISLLLQNGRRGIAFSEQEVNSFHHALLDSLVSFPS